MFKKGVCKGKTFLPNENSLNSNEISKIILTETYLKPNIYKRFDNKNHFYKLALKPKIKIIIIVH